MQSQAVENIANNCLQGSNVCINEHLDPMPLIFISRAMGRNKLLYQDIDTLYESNQVEIYNCTMLNDEAKRIYESDFFKELSFISEIYSKKAFCLLNYCVEADEEEMFNKLQNILIKGWKKIYDYIIRKKKISLIDVTRYYIRKNSKWLVDELIDIQVITYIFCIWFEIELDTEEETFRMLNESLNFDIKFKVLMNKERDKYWPQDITHSITDLEKKKLDKIIDRIFKEYSKLEIIDNLVCFVGKNSMENFNAKIVNIFGFEHLDCCGIFSNTNILKKDLEEIIFCYFLKQSRAEDGSHFIEKEVIDEKNVNIEEITKFLINNLYLKLLLKEYNCIKKYYFRNNKETMFMKNQNLENQIVNLQNSLDNIKDKFNSLSKEYQKLEKENKNLKQQMKVDDNNKVEIIKLRNFLFNLDSQQEYKDEKINYDELLKLKGVIVGGTQKWQQKMKELFKSCSFISEENINFDENIIKNSEIVIIYVNYLSHALYYKVIDVVNKNNIKVAYIKYNQNVDIVRNQIYKSLKESNR